MERMYFRTFFAGDLVRSLRVSMRNGLGALSTFSTSMCEKEETVVEKKRNRTQDGFCGERHVGEPRHTTERVSR